MKAAEVTEEWLRSIDFRGPTLNAPSIAGVMYRSLKAHVDGRGDVTELWSAPWGFETPQHVYQSATDYGVVKCWHLHEEHTDQFTVSRGKLQVSLADVREDSETFGSVDTFIVGIQNPGLIKIPPGIIHGWKALSRPEVIVVNLQTHVYDPMDEFKFPWDSVLGDVWQPKNG